MTSMRKLAFFPILALAAMAPRTLAQDVPPGYVIVPITPSLTFVGAVTPLTPTIHRGGNNLFLVGEQGGLLVDGDYTDSAAALRQALRTIADAPVRIVVNTHYHDDHVGANESLAAEGAVVIAQERARADMLVDHYNEDVGATLAAAPPGDLPAVTFPEKASFYFAGEEIEAVHVVAHTDSDAILFFKKANVVHMGDVFFNGMFPFIDRSAGGGIDGMIRAGRFVLSRIDDHTVVVPGHGALGNREMLRTYLRMLETSRQRVKALKDRGMSLDQAVAAKPLADLDPTWGWFFVNGDLFTRIIYNGLPCR
jgi:cyclase